MTNEYKNYETVGLILLEESLDYHDPSLSKKFAIAPGCWKNTSLQMKTLSREYWTERLRYSKKRCNSPTR